MVNIHKLKSNKRNLGKEIRRMALSPKRRASAINRKISEQKTVIEKIEKIRKTKGKK